MRKLKFIWSLMLCSALTLCACTTNDEEEDNGSGNGGNKGEITGVMETLQLNGFVRDTDGNPLEGVTVTSGTSTMTTNASGMFTFTQVNVNNNRTVLSFTKEGYFSVVKSQENADGDNLEVVMCSKGNGTISSEATYTSSTAKELSAGGMKIEMPKDGYVVDATGKSYSGQVKTDMMYLDPNNEYFSELMPGGDLAAVRTDGSSTQLVSYGMTNVNMTDANGNKLQLKDGETAKLTFPVPEGMTDNLPDEIPLWTFNESTGLWEEEGVATLQGNVYVGEVKHFSWTNLDYPEEQGTVKGYVRDEKGNAVKNTFVQVGQLQTRTDNSGYYEQTVPANQSFEVSVKPQYYGNYKDIVAVQVDGLNPRETRTVNLTLPVLHTVSGTIVNDAGGPRIASIWIEYGNNKTTSALSDIDGAFTVQAPQGYKGDATLKVQTAEGDVKDVDIYLDGNNDVYVYEVHISSQTTKGIYVYLSDGSNAYFNVESTADLSSGVMIIDDKLYCANDEDADDVYFALQINDYKEGTTKYTDVTTYVNNGNANEYLYGASEVNITRNDNSFVFKLDGKGTYAKNSSGKYDENATYTGIVTMNFIFSGKSLNNVIPTQAGFPSFTPELSTAAPLALLLSECAYADNGGMIYYNGGITEFNTLKAAASKAGLKKVDEESEGIEYQCITYYSNNKFISIEYDAECDAIGSNADIMNDDAPIEVIVFDGMDKSVFNSLMGAKAKKPLAKIVRKKGLRN